MIDFVIRVSEVWWQRIYVYLLLCLHAAVAMDTAVAIYSDGHIILLTSALISNILQK